MSFSDEVQAYLKENKIKKRELAEFLDVSPSLLSHWFAGRASLHPSILQRMAEFMKR